MQRHWRSLSKQPHLLVVYKICPSNWNALCCPLLLCLACDKQQPLQMAGNNKRRNMYTSASCRSWNVLQVFAWWPAPEGVIRVWCTAHWSYLSFSAREFWEKVCCFSFKIPFEANSLTRVHVGTSSRSVQQVVFVFTFSLSAPRIHDRFIFQKPNKKMILRNGKWSF